MSDNQIDYGDWFLPSADHPITPLDNDIYQLPPNISDSSLWNNMQLFDISIPNDPTTPVDTVPQQPARNQLPNSNPNPNPKQVPVSTITDIHINTSPITTRIDGVPTTPETFPTPNTSSRPPLAQLPNNPVPPTKTPRSSKRTPINKSIGKNPKLPVLHLDQRRYPPPQKTTKHKATRQKKFSPKRTPTRRPKVEAPLLSPLLGSKKNPLNNSNNKSPAQKRPADESRERHNQMMRENRHRFNNKFKELTDLLDTFKEPGCEYKPMKNKIQILERAIYQYAQMQTKHARYENELMFSPEHPEDVKNEFLNVFIAVPSLPDACNLVIQNMCATLDWKYGEAWIRRPGQVGIDCGSNKYELCTSFVSKNNMPDTRQLLEQFSLNSKANGVDEYLLTLSQHRHAIWIPDMSTKEGKSGRADTAKQAGITTMLMIPIYVSDDECSLPDAIVTLMHVNDDLLSYPRDERPYDSQCMTKLLDLVAAVVKSRAKVASQV